MNFLLLKLKWLSKNKKIELIILLLVIIASVAAVSKLVFFNYSFKIDSPVDALKSPILNTKQGSILLADMPEEKCYWVRYTYYNGKDILEIREYKSPNKDCYGELLNTTQIPLKTGANIIGDTSCICGGKSYLLKKLDSWGLSNIEIVTK